MSMRPLLQTGIRTLVCLALLPSSSSATLLYVSSYAGTVSTLNLTTTGRSSGSLDLVASSLGCLPNPSWLTLAKSESTLYCLNEGLTSPNGSLATLETSPSGGLTPISNVTTPSGPVSAVIYGHCGSGIALAEYSGSSMSAYSLAGTTAPAEIHAEFFRMAGPGPNPGRQDAPHPHEAVLDPTGDFLIVPDLGADLVRVWAVDQETLALTPSTPLVAAPGSGPRHVAFLQTAAKTFMYLISELANTITAYEVTYRCRKSLAFKEVFRTSTHGDGWTPPGDRIVTAAEIHLSPDNRFILVTSRNESDTSDPLISFRVNAETGALTHHQTIGTGGLIPRQFSINKAGTLVAVGTQGDGRVAVFGRDVSTGNLTAEPVAHTVIAGGQVTCVIFDE